MTTIINASNGSTSGLITTADASGVLQLQTNNGTPAITLNTTQALGVGTSPAYGTSGQFLTSQGSAASPTWTTPSSGAMTLISTQTASASTAFAWTGLSGYTKYYIVFNFDSFSGTDTVRMYLGYGSTPTYYSSGYNFGYIIGGATTLATAQFSNSTSAIFINASTNGLGGGNVTISNFLASTSSYTTWQSNTASSVTSPQVTLAVSNGSLNPSLGTLTAIKLSTSGGTTTMNGSASLYGISS